MQDKFGGALTGGDTETYLNKFAGLVLEATGGIPRHVLHCVRVLWYCLKEGVSVSVKAMLDVVYKAVLKHAPNDLVCPIGDWGRLEEREKLAFRTALVWAGLKCLVSDETIILEATPPLAAVTIGRLMRYFPIHFSNKDDSASGCHLVVGTFVAQAIEDVLQDNLCTILASFASNPLAVSVDCGTLFELLVQWALVAKCGPAGRLVALQTLVPSLSKTGCAVKGIVLKGPLKTGKLPAVNDGVKQVRGEVVATAKRMHKADYPHLLPQLAVNTVYQFHPKSNSGHLAVLVQGDSTMHEVLIQCKSGSTTTVTASMLAEEIPKLVHGVEVAGFGTTVGLLVSQYGIGPELASVLEGSADVDACLWLTTGNWQLVNVRVEGFEDRKKGLWNGATNSLHFRGTLHVVGPSRATKPLQRAAKVQAVTYACQGCTASGCSLANTFTVVATRTSIAVPVGLEVCVLSKGAVAALVGKTNLLNLERIQSLQTNVASPDRPLAARDLVMSISAGLDGMFVHTALPVVCGSLRLPCVCTVADVTDALESIGLQPLRLELDAEGV